MPSGSETRAVFTLELASAADASKGTPRSTAAGSGESVCWVPGVTAIVGLKGTTLQPVGATLGGSAASKAADPSGNFGSGDPTESARRRVE